MNRINMVFIVLLASVILACDDSSGSKETTKTDSGAGGAQNVGTTPGLNTNPTGGDDRGDSSDQMGGFLATLPSGSGGTVEIAMDSSAGEVMPDMRCQVGLRCLDRQTQEVCDSDGNLSQTMCGENEVCLSATGQCVPTLCNSNESRCLDDRRVETCSATGDEWVQLECPADKICTGGQCVRMQCLPQVLFALDGSSSMVSEWENVRNSVLSVVAANPQVAFGMLMFPTGLGCSTEMGWPHVPIRANANAEIEGWFQNNGASGGATPLISTMEWIADRANDVFPSPNTRSLIIMTEGLDRCSCQDDSDDPQSTEYEDCLTNDLERATRRLVDKGVDVYVIGYKFLESRDVLNVIASNGNTDFPEFIFAGSEVTLTNAFESVVFDVKRCR